jgi:hypothetical protein
MSNQATLIVVAHGQVCERISTTVFQGVINGIDALEVLLPTDRMTDHSTLTDHDQRLRNLVFTGVVMSVLSLQMSSFTIVQPKDLYTEPGPLSGSH